MGKAWKSVHNKTVDLVDKRIVDARQRYLELFSMAEQYLDEDDRKMSSGVKMLLLEDLATGCHGKDDKWFHVNEILPEIKACLKEIGVLSELREEVMALGE